VGDGMPRNARRQRHASSVPRRCTRR
jgi:hypothetical protein